MTIPIEQFQEWLGGKEGENLEFKEARNSFSFDKLVRYLAALANEKGGSIILGVTDRRPRTIVGSRAFLDVEATKVRLVDKLRLRIEVTELQHPDGRVLILTAPPRPIGVPISVDGAYLMRTGESLVPMTPDMLRRIFEESGPDFSAEVCTRATLSDLDPVAIANFRSRWYARSKSDSVRQASLEQLLRDSELVVDAGVTFAALILLGKHSALGKHLAQSEVIFEYRSSEAPGPASQREEFRSGFLLFYERLWELVNSRNDRQHYQDGLFMVEIPTFNESATREAVLNAVAHRDYRAAGSVFVRQFSRRIELVSPGGFPEGVTVDNILDRQLPRNRRLADALARCGLVERAGQGANRIFESCIREGKALPDFSETDDWQVSLTLHGQVRDSRFVRFLEHVGQETQASFDTRELLVLDLVHRELGIPTELRPLVPRLLDLGVLERIGRGRGTRYLLSRRFYGVLGQRGAHTRRRGLDRGESKALLLRHLETSRSSGAPISELQQVLPSQSRDQIKRLLNELRSDGLVRLKGERRAARWFVE